MPWHMEFLNLLFWVFDLIRYLKWNWLSIEAVRGSIWWSKSLWYWCWLASNTCTLENRDALLHRQMLPVLRVRSWAAKTNSWWLSPLRLIVSSCCHSWSSLIWEIVKIPICSVVSTKEWLSCSLRFAELAGCPRSFTHLSHELQILAKLCEGSRRCKSSTSLLWGWPSSGLWALTLNAHIS